jgi:hypothetical protein
MIRYLILVLALLLVAIRPAPAQQGNLPKPVQSLPAYPPVRCVTVDWTVESCEWRQVQAAVEGVEAVAKAWAKAAKSEIPRYVLRDEPGGEYWEHWNRFKAIADSGDLVEIRGACLSACTLVMVHVQKDHLCFGEGASLQFHVSRHAETGEPDPDFTTRMMVNQYPQDIRKWILTKGGVAKMTIAQMWTLRAADLWSMGYPKCEPEASPVPMTKKATQYRPRWETAAEAEKREREKTWRKYQDAIKTW